MEHKELRSEKLLKNSFWSMLGYLLYAVAGFISRSVFVQQLGDELTGVSTLFNSILGLLSMAELGFSSAISIHLYKPVADKDERKIAALMNLYGKAYRIIAIVISLVGLGLLPFVRFFVKTDAVIPHLHWYFFLYVVRTAFSYCYAYKGTLISVYQEEYRKSNITNLLLILSTVAQTAVMLLTANFTLYLLIYVANTLLTNIWVTKTADRLYPYLKRYKNETVSQEEQKSIFSYIKAESMNRLASSVKYSTDSMIVSAFVNVVVTGIVGNYNMVVNTVNTLLGFFFTNSTPAVGNLVVTADKDAQYHTFLDLEYIAFWVYGFLSTGMMCVLTPFVRDIWIRQAHLVLDSGTLFLLLLNFFLVGSIFPATVFLNVRGLIQRMPYMNVLNVLFNLVLSILLVKPYGVTGVYIGTVLSLLLTTFPMTQYLVLKHHFDGNYRPYVKLYLYYLAVTFLAGSASVFFCGRILCGGFLGILLQVLVCTLVFNGIFLLCSFRSREFRSLFQLARRILHI